MLSSSRPGEAGAARAKAMKQSVRELSAPVKSRPLLFLAVILLVSGLALWHERFGSHRPKHIDYGAIIRAAEDGAEASSIEAKVREIGNLLASWRFRGSFAQAIWHHYSNLLSFLRVHCVIHVVTRSLPTKHYMYFTSSFCTVPLKPNAFACSNEPLAQAPPKPLLSWLTPALVQWAQR